MTRSIIYLGNYGMVLWYRILRSCSIFSKQQLGCIICSLMLTSGSNHFQIEPIQILSSLISIFLNFHPATRLKPTAKFLQLTCSCAVMLLWAAGTTTSVLRKSMLINMWVNRAGDSACGFCAGTQMHVVPNLADVQEGEHGCW